MRGAFIRKLGEPLVISDEIEIPQVNRGQVLVEIAFSGVCHSQLMEARGLRGEDRFVPHFLGHEATGIVRAIGDGVTKVKIGQRVVLGWIKGNGLDGGGSKYRLGSEYINAGGVTTFQSHALVSENRLVPLDEGVPMDVGVLFGCAIPTGAGIVINDIGPKAQGTIVIWGLGGIGLSALLATQLRDFGRRIVVDIEPTKEGLAKSLGATDFICSSKMNAVHEILELTGGKGADFVIEAAGLTKTIEAAFSVTRKGGGVCIFASHPKHGDRISIDPFDLISGKRILGTWGGECSPDRDVPVFAELYKTGRWKLESFFSKRYSLDQVNQALEDLENRKVTRALLEINPRLGCA